MDLNKLSFEDLISEIEKTKKDIGKQQNIETLDLLSKEKKMKELAQTIELLNSQMKLLENQISQIKNQDVNDGWSNENLDIQKHLTLLNKNLVKPLPPPLRIEKETFYNRNISYIHNFEQMDLSQKMRFILDNKLIEKALLGSAIRKYERMIDRIGRIAFAYSGLFKTEGARLRRVANRLNLKESFRLDDVFINNEKAILATPLPKVFFYDYLNLSYSSSKGNMCLLDIINDPNPIFTEYVNQLGDLSSTGKIIKLLTK